MPHSKTYRVLHAPTSVGGNPQGLSKALMQLGISSYSLVFSQNCFHYSVDYVLWSPKDSFLLKEIKRIFCIIYNVFRYDIIHYNFGTTISDPSHLIQLKVTNRWNVKKIKFYYLLILQCFELKLYRSFNKKLFITYQGDDARQGGFLNDHFQFNIASQVDSSYYSPQSDKLKKFFINRLTQYCEKIYTVNPDLMYVLPKSTIFVPYSHIFLDELKPFYTQLEKRFLRIGHAPSHRKVKGTDIIIKAVENLKKNGYEFDFILVEGKQHTEAIEIYKTIDILVDQLWGGWYGGLAVEAMALGKPVMVYIRNEDLKFIPYDMAQDLPFIQVNPINFESKLREVLDMPRYNLLKIAERSRNFVEKWHNPLQIASQIKKDYEESLIY